MESFVHHTKTKFGSMSFVLNLKCHGLKKMNKFIKLTLSAIADNIITRFPDCSKKECSCGCGEILIDLIINNGFVEVCIILRSKDLIYYKNRTDYGTYFEYHELNKLFQIIQEDFEQHAINTRLHSNK